MIKLQIFTLTVKIHHKLHLQCRFLNHEHLTCTEYAEFWLRLKLRTGFNGNLMRLIETQSDLLSRMASVLETHWELDQNENLAL